MYIDCKLAICPIFKIKPNHFLMECCPTSQHIPYQYVISTRKLKFAAKIALIQMVLTAPRLKCEQFVLSLKTCSDINTISRALRKKL